VTTGGLAITDPLNAASQRGAHRHTVKPTLASGAADWPRAEGHAQHGTGAPMVKNAWSRSQRRFVRDYENQWSHLSRMTNLMVILNISLFFLTELVTRQSYYYTFYSLLFLGVVYLGLVLPLGFLNRLWYYLIFLTAEALGIYFLVVSAWFWIVTNRV
jgi:hypothetical protein